MLHLHDKANQTFRLETTATQHGHSPNVHAPRMHPGPASEVLIWFIQTMTSRMWTGRRTRLSFCRQSDRGNGGGRRPSGRRTEWNVCHVVFITLTPPLPALWPFFGTAAARPVTPSHPSLFCRSPSYFGKSHWQDFFPLCRDERVSATNPTSTTTNPFSYPPHLFTLSCCLPLQSLQLTSSYCWERNAWGAAGDCRVWNDWASGILRVVHCQESKLGMAAATAV